MSDIEKIEKIATQVEDREIRYLDELKKACEKVGVDWTEVVEYCQWDCCDRCEVLAESEDLFYTLEYDYDQEEDDRLLGVALDHHRQEYWDALCYDCVRQLICEGHEFEEEKRLNEWWAELYNSSDKLVFEGTALEFEKWRKTNHLNDSDHIHMRRNERA